MSATFSVVAGGPSGPRLGQLQTAHGSVETPAYVPLAAYGAVSSLSVADLEALGVQALAVSLYGLLQRPGTATVAALGGLRAFLGWRGPILGDPGDREILVLATDPGPDAARRPLAGRKARGSRGRLLRVQEASVELTSFVDGGRLRLEPGELVSLQALLGADLLRAARVAAPAGSVGSRALQAGWDRRAMEVTPGLEAPLLIGLPAPDDLATEPFGWSRSASDASPGGWPADLRLRLTLDGAGPPSALGAIACGTDLVEGSEFASAAERAQAFSDGGGVSLLDEVNRLDDRALEPGCECATCTFASRGYLHHLFRADEMAAPTLVAHHNLHVLLRLERCARAWIARGRFESEAARYLARWHAGSSNHD